MKILAHRGLWEHPSEKNSKKALLEAIKAGFGVETDLRDLDGEIVISHDMPNKGVLPLKGFLDEASQKPAFRKVIFALNIKSDGIGSQAKKILGEYGILENFFFFDMSAPELYLYSQIFEKKNICTRISDIEQEPLLAGKAGWIWVDGFESDWQDWQGLAKKYPTHRLGVVSPELHASHRKADYHIFWESLNKLDEKLIERICLCTDFPAKAKEFFL
ncbi:hypothetical protein COU37_05705 [Candidatus Micrarchaeota archaeon CG10_big_fil_rev_8_21_14_0_10_45_29]|nr:MAG: hypothetical protein COU37_05705 [Candidatus Micrarchaeota archaeon CG10_big_fil_rev_8_21_14_0_10_45_29]